MIGLPKKELIQYLNKIRKTLCIDIDAQGRFKKECRCKFGFRPNKYNDMNGCPELKMVTVLLEKMSESEFDRICQRAKVVVFYD